MSCPVSGYHGEHYYAGDQDEDAWCKGSYEVVETFGPWRIVLDPDEPSRGYIDTDPNSDLPTYYVDSMRVHEGQNGVYSWKEHMSEKMWAQPHMTEFLAALDHAQRRWPRR